MRRGFGSGLFGVHRLPGAVYGVVVDAVFDIGRAIFDAVEPLVVGFVLGEQQLRLPLAVEHPLAVVVVRERDGFGALRTLSQV
jgi:hypothetical protein